MTTMLDFLKGKVIRQLWVREGEGALAFVTDDGTFAVDTDGDCCSETWFADIIGVSALFCSPDWWGAYVREIEHYELPDDPSDGRSRQDSDSVMGFRIKTGRGVCDVIYRNSSNGYYGGSLDRVFVPANLDGWKQITADWQA